MQEASHRYQYALKKIPNTDQPIESANTFQQLKFNFLLNLSRCKRKMNVSNLGLFTAYSSIINFLTLICLQEASEAIDLAAQAIELKPNNYDGFYARAKALMEVGNIAAALLDAKAALDRSATQTVEIKTALLRLHDDLEKRCLEHDSDAKHLYTELTDL